MPRHEYEQEHEDDGLRREPAPFNRDPSGSAWPVPASLRALPDGSRLNEPKSRARSVHPTDSARCCRTADFATLFTMNTNKAFDCVLCGSCVVDILVRPVPLDVPIGGGKLLETQPIEVTTGGIVSNAGIAMARLGMKVSAFSYTGSDDWASVIRRNLEQEGVDTRWLLPHPTGATSTTAVLIDPSGERSFVHCVGAPRLMDKAHFLKHLDVFAQSR